MKILVEKSYRNAFINKKFYIPLVTLLLLFSCNEQNSVNSGNSYRLIDPNILHTDSLGIIIGGDSTDWCYRGDNQLSFNPAYPNPTFDTFKLNLTLAIPDTLSLFFIDADTNYIFQNLDLSIGTYEVAISSKALNYNLITKRIYLQTKNNYFNRNICAFYGDIQFY